MKGQRSGALDALRGYAILTMVLSGAVASTLPAWMYHAQTPPPDHAFNPTVYGITWVDLVFPFFLFAMGAAMPFSLGRRVEKGESRLKLSFDSLLRGIQLAFFAVFIQHMYSFSLANPENYSAWATTLAAFVLLFPMFMRMPWQWKPWIHHAVKLLAFLVAIVMLLYVPYANGRHFDLHYSNIIILVLANMAVFGSVIYLYTMHRLLTRIAVLPCVMAILLSSSDAFAGSWQKALFDFTPFDWLYQFRFLKYLFIVLPGTYAGEMLYKWLSSTNNYQSGKKDKRNALVLLVLTFSLVGINLYGLFTRKLELNFIASVVLLLLGFMVIRKPESAFSLLWKRLFFLGGSLVLWGLFFEAFEGGIRKDSSTFSYYFLTSGLACMALIFFSVLCDFFGRKKITAFLTLSGQNPMIAYVSADMVVYPLAKMAGVLSVFFVWCADGWWGLFQGIVITALVTLITIFFSKKQLYWRT